MLPPHLNKYRQTNQTDNGVRHPSGGAALDATIQKPVRQGGNVTILGPEERLSPFPIPIRMPLRGFAYIFFP